MDIPIDVEADLEAAIAARNAGNFDLACAAYLSLLERIDLSFSGVRSFICSELGYVYRNKKDFPQAVDWLRRSLELRPYAEIASLQLFFALFDQGLVTRALEEAVRFLSSRDSNEYREMFSGDGFTSDMTPEALILAERVRELLHKLKD